MKPVQQTSLILRRNVYSLFIILIFSLLVVGFARLQVANRSMYLQKSIDNSIRRIQKYPVRGLIYDSNDKIIVETRPSYSVAVIPKVVSKDNLAQIEKMLGLTHEDVKRELNKFFGYRPILIASDISYENVIYLEEHKLDMPGVYIITGPKRHYPDKVFSPHIFGALGEITPGDQLANPAFEPGDIIGKSGLEKKYDADIRGAKGIEFLRVDASGKELGIYDIHSNLEPVHGSDLHLHMDYNLQYFADSLFLDKRGSLVAIDVRNGGILALVSKPDYDPRILSGSIDAQIWKQLVENPGHPLYSRAIQSCYPPGSTYKIITAIAALEEGIITPSWQASCPGYMRIGKRIIKCWNTKGHGTLDLYGAIKNSCNVYFAQLGLKVGLDKWEKYSRKFGFGQLTGIDLPNENAGLLPSPAYYEKYFGKNGWTNGTMANLSIGQGELLTTPLQMAQFAMILANKGVYYTPHLVDNIYDYSAHKPYNFPFDAKYITGVSESVYTIVREGMREVIAGGTGRLGKVFGMEMAGKTGTAQNPHGEPHAWFIGFAPFDHPEVAVAVVLENSGGGGANAAPIARQTLEMYFYGKLMSQFSAAAKSGSVVNSDSLLKKLNLKLIQPIQIGTTRQDH
jgi:penicillin-binding protein 2